MPLKARDRVTKNSYYVSDCKCKHRIYRKRGEQLPLCDDCGNVSWVRD